MFYCKYCICCRDNVHFLLNKQSVLAANTILVDCKNHSCFAAKNHIFLTKTIICCQKNTSFPWETMIWVAKNISFGYKKHQFGLHKIVISVATTISVGCKNNQFLSPKPSFVCRLKKSGAIVKTVSFKCKNNQLWLLKFCFWQQHHKLWFENNQF